MSGTKQNKNLLDNLRMQRLSLINAVTADSIQEFILWSNVFQSAKALETTISSNPDLAKFRKKEIKELEDLEPKIKLVN